MCQKCEKYGDFLRAVRNLVDFSLVTKLTKHVSKVRETVRKCKKIRRNDCETFFMTSDSQKVISQFLDSYFCTKFQISQPGWYPNQAIKNLHMADFFRVVGCLVNFSLVTRRTKHVSKVQEVIKKCEKICEDVIRTLLMTLHTQKLTSCFLDSNFWAKLQISWPGWSADRSIKILHMPNDSYIQAELEQEPPPHDHLISSIGERGFLQCVGAQNHDILWMVLTWEWMVVV